MLIVKHIILRRFNIMARKQNLEVKRVNSNPEIGLSDVQLKARYEAKMVNKRW